MEKDVDLLSFLIEVETEGFDPENENHIKAAQRMLDQGFHRQLQGSWGRLIDHLVRAGLIFPRPTLL